MAGFGSFDDFSEGIQLSNHLLAGSSGDHNFIRSSYLFGLGDRVLQNGMIRVNHMEIVEHAFTRNDGQPTGREASAVSKAVFASAIFWICLFKECWKCFNASCAVTLSVILRVRSY
jgi:hypothetical protein